MPKNVEKKEKSEIVKKSTEEMINSHVGFSMVAGAIPIPVVDIIAVTASNSRSHNYRANIM